MDNNLWTRRTNTSSKLSLSTPSPEDPTGRGSSVFQKRFNSTSKRPDASAQGGGLKSPSSASTAFGLGQGVFASFGSVGTPKTLGNPFDSGFGAFGAAKTPTADRPCDEGPGGGAALPPAKSASKAPSMASISEASAATDQGPAAAAAADGGNSSAASVASDSPDPLHPLRSAWCFWFRPPLPKNHAYMDYEKTLHGIATVRSVEDFFLVYRHLKRPSSLPPVSDYHLFKEGIRPIWEDDVNRKGGKWVVRMKKGVADRYWEDLLLALVGDQFGDEGEDVCGAVLSIRNGEDTLSIWTSTDGGRVRKIRDTMRQLLDFPGNTRIDFKSHDSSLQQRAAAEESRREKSANNNNNSNNTNNSNNSHQPHGEKRQVGGLGDEFSRTAADQ